MKRNRYHWLYVSIALLTTTIIIILTPNSGKANEIENTNSLYPVQINSADDTEREYNFELPFEYDYISDFSNGYGLLKKNGQWTLVDSNYRLFPSTSEYEVVNISNDVLCIQSQEDSKYGLIDIYGNILVSPQYNSPINYSEGLALVEKGGKFGYIDAAGNLIVDFKYDTGVSFHDGLAAVGDGNHFYFINRDDEIISGPFENLGGEVYIHTTAYMEYSEGYTAFFKEDPNLPAATYGGGYGGWGFLNKQGNVVITPKYKSVRPFYEGLAAVETFDNEWIYINKCGEAVMEGAPGDFFNGLACVGNRFIDKTGKTIIKIPEGYSVSSSSSKGFDNFYYGDLIMVYHETENRYAVMNKQGKIVLESDDYEELKIFNGNHVAVKKNEKWGILR